MRSRPWPLHELGDPSHPAIIFLHGFMGLGQDWKNIARPLSEKFYCLFPDLPGHGENPLDAQPGHVAWASALRDTLQIRSLKRAYLVGYSMGGRLALYFSLKYPELVEGLAMESTNPGITDPKERQARAAWDDNNKAHIQSKGLASFLTDWYEMPLFASLKNIPGLKDELRVQRAQQNPENMARVIRHLSPGRQPSLWERLPDLSPSTLLVAGLLDEKYTQVSRQMAEIIPDCELALIPACGHNAHLEQPDRYIEIIQKWLYSGKNISNPK
ncbi:MAG: 2-succinyl-6-hydroxy-2,4-cyclohexadiene-1-carboxylate synthase [Anaerolineales bacterium]|uniref:Putative 2-succinyl-6-hydroxy-2,4-cyclohexadiene-1-carboxylate synthase n=1 Tax=Candidatus Desulfolinea nitratireducens TaxID=2841698 RepID=A0A8J6NIH6_9CHLR|nr:2-succinyl-6-hydroxy-2,4-cyclohexadiene-1-carboxylate synthase [Candidatus Desulfolinea nitratireducens]